MKLKIGDKVKVIKRDGKGSINIFKGEIIAFYYTYIVVKVSKGNEYFKYIWNECFNVADVVNPEQSELRIKINKEWIKITKDMLPAKMIKIEHLESSRAFQTSKWKRSKLNE